MSDDAIPLLRAPRRWFTPSEANALLPQLVPLVEALTEGLERAEEVGQIYEATADIQGRWEVARDLEELREANRETLEAIQAHGVDLKGLTPALIDFPALRDGREVYLCWRQGESEVTHWHPLHTGIRGREVIDPESAAAWEYWS